MVTKLRNSALGTRLENIYLSSVSTGSLNYGHEQNKQAWIASGGGLKEKGEREVARGKRGGVKRVSGAEHEHSLSKARVKHDGAWAP